MDLLKPEQWNELLRFVPDIKSTITHWQYVKVRLLSDVDDTLTIEEVARGICEIYRYKRGKAFICNAHEILVLVRLGKDMDHHAVTERITKTFPDYSFEVFVDNISKMGLLKLELIIQGMTKPAHVPSDVLDQMRQNRTYNCIMVADDDMYIRTLIEAALKSKAEIINIVDGTSVMAEYEKNAPDMLLLDIHMPGKGGPELLREVLEVDPKAYVVMLSADSSRLNVMVTAKDGASGFLTKPFDKTKLMEYVDKCPTLK